MCFESICGFSCTVALMVYYLPTLIIGLVALCLHLRRRGFFKRSYVRLLRWLRRFAAVFVLFASVASFADCTPMTFEECSAATNSLARSAQDLRYRLQMIEYSANSINEDTNTLNSIQMQYCSNQINPPFCNELTAFQFSEYANDILGIVSVGRAQLDTIDNSISDISCCSSNGGNDGGGGGNDGGSSCTNCACAEQIVAINTSLDNYSQYIQAFERNTLTPFIQGMNELKEFIETWYWDNLFYWDKLAILDDDWYSYLQRLKQSVSQIRNTITPDKISGFWNFNNILQGQAFIYSAEYKTQLLTELFGNTITQQLNQAFRLSHAFAAYSDSPPSDWLGIVNPDWQAAMDAYTTGGDGDGSMDDWIKGDGNVTNYFHRMETYNQQIVKFLALMNRTNDLETISTNNPYADIDAAYDEADRKATSDIAGTSSQLDSLKSPFQRLYDAFALLRSSLEIQNPSSSTSFRWVPDNIDFSQQGISSQSDGISLDLSESSTLGRGVALFNTLFSFVWVVLCVVVCGYLAFRCALLVKWVFTFLFGLVEKISDR